MKLELIFFGILNACSKNYNCPEVTSQPLVEKLYGVLYKGSNCADHETLELLVMHDTKFLNDKTARLELVHAFNIVRLIGLALRLILYGISNASSKNYPCPEVT